MERTTAKIEGENAYVSGLLWRDEEPSLPNNYDKAKRSLNSLEKFENNPEIETDMPSRSKMTLRGYVKRLSKEKVPNGR